MRFDLAIDREFFLKYSFLSAFSMSGEKKGKKERLDELSEARTCDYAYCMCTRGSLKSNVRVWRRTPRYWRRLASRRHAVREHSAVHIRAGATDTGSLTFFSFLSLVSCPPFFLFVARANVRPSPFSPHRIESKVKWFSAGISRSAR